MTKKPKTKTKSEPDEDDNGDQYDEEQQQEADEGEEKAPPLAPIEQCVSCHYYRNGECHHAAPAPYDVAMVSILAVMYDIAGSQKILANITGAPPAADITRAKWPAVLPTDWCGNWIEQEQK